MRLIKSIRPMHGGLSICTNKDRKVVHSLSSSLASHVQTPHTLFMLPTSRHRSGY